MAQVSIRSVDKIYDAYQAILGLNLEIQDHGFVVLVGPSGCGKSTTLRMVAGLEDITSGEIWIGDRKINDVAPGDRDIAMVFQNYALYPHMSVRENIAFGLRQRKTARHEVQRRVDEIAGMLDIVSLLDRKPRALSGGQRQRVAIGRAMVRNPQVFLFDEPLSNLDAKLRVQMRTEIKRLHQLVPTTTIYVTHDQVEAMTLADQVVVMNAGRIEQIGAPQTLYQNPANRFVAGFIGSPAMNFFDGELVAAGDGLAVALRNGAKLQVPSRRRDAYGPHVGKPVVLGLRPEHLTEPRGRLDEARLEIAVEVVEPMGAETLVYFTLAGTLHCARLDSGTGAVAREAITLAADMNRMHLIESEAGRVISPDPR